MNKYLEFREFLSLSGRKTEIFNVYNKSEEYLGVIKWKSTWRKYCYLNLNDTWFDSNCLKEITNFLDKLNKKHKERNKK